MGSLRDGVRQRELIRIEMSRTIQKGLLGKTVIEQPPDWKDAPATLAESFYDIRFSGQEGTDLGISIFPHSSLLKSMVD